LRGWWSGPMAQVVECLPTKSDALSSIPSTTKKKEEKKRILSLTYNAISKIFISKCYST
jgi:hypothetical protein